MSRKRRIKAAKITHISLVPKGANRMPVIFKADDQSVDLEMLCKADMERGELTAIVYAPENRDTQGDIASATVIKDMMYEAARDGVQIDMRHDGKALKKNQAFVAESFLVQKDDPRFDGIKTYDGESVDPVGSWGVVIKVDDPDLRQKFRDGEWNGVSMGGTAEVETEKAGDMTEQVVTAMAKALGIAPSGAEDDDMTKDELTAALKEGNKSLGAEIISALKELLPKPVEKTDVEKKADADAAAVVAAEAKAKANAPKPPIFKGDMTDPEAIVAHQRKLAVFSLRKDVDWTDGESVAEYQVKLAEFTEEFGEMTDADKGKVKPAASQRPARKAEDEGATCGTYEGMELAKGDENCAQIGAEMAKWANQQNGTVTA